MQINTRGFLPSREHPPALLTWVKGLGGWSRLPLQICGCSAWGVGVEMEAWETLSSLGTAFRGAEPSVAGKQAVLRSRRQLRGQGRAEDDGPPDHG